MEAQRQSFSVNTDIPLESCKILIVLDCVKKKSQFAKKLPKNLLSFYRHWLSTLARSALVSPLLFPQYLLLQSTWYRHSHLIFIRSTPSPSTQDTLQLCAGEQQFNIRGQQLGPVAMVNPKPPGWSSAGRPPLSPAWLYHRQEVLPAPLHLAGHDGLADDGRHLPGPP